MKTRILTAVGMAVVGIPILIFSDYIIFPMLLSLLALAAVFEMFRVFGFEKCYALSAPAYLIALILPILGYYFSSEHTYGFVLTAAATLFAYLIYSFFVAVFKKGLIKFGDISQLFSVTVYVVMSFVAICVMRYMNAGIFNLVIMLVAAWGSDTSAYFAGMLFGRHKLIPELSPKKTVEGAIGGVIGATLLMLLYGFIVSKATEFEPNYLILAILGFTLSAVSQVGDLIASLIKRERGIKDYGKIFPGHGGVMDRFDSILSISTILMIVCILFPPFV